MRFSFTQFFRARVPPWRPEIKTEVMDKKNSGKVTKSEAGPKRTGYASTAPPPETLGMRVIPGLQEDSRWECPIRYIGTLLQGATDRPQRHGPEPYAAKQKSVGRTACKVAPQLTGETLRALHQAETAKGASLHNRRNHQQ